MPRAPPDLDHAISTSCCASTCAISTRADPTDHLINAHPQAARGHPSAQPSGRSDETGSAAHIHEHVQHEVTRFLGTHRVREPDTAAVVCRSPLVKEPGPLDGVTPSDGAQFAIHGTLVVFTVLTDTYSSAAISEFDSVLARYRSTVRSRSVSGSMSRCRAWVSAADA
jgi:hypothetical protein